VISQSSTCSDSGTAAVSTYGIGVGITKAGQCCDLRLSVRLPHDVELISHSESARCVLFAYQVPPGAVPPRANLLPISAPASPPAGDEQRPRLIDGREVFEERPSPTVVQRPGAQGGGGGGRPTPSREETVGAVPGRADR